MATCRSESELYEAARAEVLRGYPFEDEHIRGPLDRLARLCARSCDAPIGLVSIVDDHRQLFVGRHGTELTETPRAWSLCAHAMLGDETMIVNDLLDDDRFADNPLASGSPPVRFYAGHPLKAPCGTPLGSICVIDTRPKQDLTPDQLDALETLAGAVMSVLDRWRTEKSEQRSNLTIVNLEQRLQVLADVMPQLLWGTSPAGSCDYVSGAWCDFTGEPAESSYSDGWIEFIHPDDRSAAVDCWAQSVASGQDYQIEYRLRHHHDDYRWMRTRAMPMHDAAGQITRWIGSCTDVHAQRETAERLDLLNRELSHRIKNIFAVIGGLVAFTMRRRPELAKAGAQLQQRVLALGRAHDCVRPYGDHSSQQLAHTGIMEMLETLLAPYGEGSRISMGGQNVAIDDRSATALALFFHELATNAAKFGSLSYPEGRVEVEVRTGKQVELVWRELGGPSPGPCSEPGFGASLIELSIVRQLAGTVEYQWRDEGLMLRASIPTAMMSR